MNEHPKLQALRLKVKRMGNWAGVRYLRNRGHSFAFAHFVIFGFYPVPTLWQVIE